MQLRAHIGGAAVGAAVWADAGRPAAVGGRPSRCALAAARPLGGLRGGLQAAGQAWADVGSGPAQTIPGMHML